MRSSYRRRSRTGLLVASGLLLATSIQVQSFSTVPLGTTGVHSSSRLNLRPSDAEDLVAAFDAFCEYNNKNEDDESRFDFEGFVKEPEDEENNIDNTLEEKTTSAVTSARSFVTKLFSLPTDMIERNWYPDNYDEEFDLNYRYGVELLYGTWKA